MKTRFYRNTLSVLVDDMLDLWHLEKIIANGDFVTAKTLRNIFIEKEEKKEKIGKKLVKLKILVEGVKFYKERNKLRLKGKIIECPQDIQKGFHTIEVGLGSRIEIEKKEWIEEHLKIIKRAEKRIGTSEPTLIQEFFIHQNKDDGLAVYGLEQVKTAATIGAVKVILVPEERLREMEELVSEVQNKGGEVRLVTTKDKIGKNFCKIYDVAAILRFSIS